MSTLAPELPIEPRESFGSDLAGMASFFIDPAGAAKRVWSKWFWVGPLIVVSVISVIVALTQLPFRQHVMENMPMPANANPEQYQHGLELGMRIAHIMVWFVPVFIVVFWLIYSLVLYAMSSVLAVNAKFRALFNLLAGCSLIEALAAVASAIILKAKGEVSTMAELQPALGLDIFMPEGTNKFLMAFFGYFTIFEIWWIIMMVLVFSKAFRVSNGKAFAAVLPLILLSLVFRLVGAVFQR